ncbi:MAG: hypothetical protein M3Y06_03675 [Actinomycetota bacterium]|nr:hypothetical protein [Actinomycetota bacterium]
MLRSRVRYERAEMSGPSDDEARAFAAAFRTFLDWVRADQLDSRERIEVVAVVGDFLGVERKARSATQR